MPGDTKNYLGVKNAQVSVTKRTQWTTMWIM